MKFLWIFFVFCTAAWADEVALEVGTVHLQVTAVKPGIFCLSASLDGPAHPAASIFLDPSPCSTTAKRIDQNGWTGLEAGDAALLVEKATGAWQLRVGTKIVAQGLVPAADPEALHLTLEEPGVSAFRAYGSGGGRDTSLLKTQGRSALGNGRAVIPYYWSAAGYGAFGVTGNDDRPAKWSYSPQGIAWNFPGRTAALYLMPAADLSQAAQRYTLLSGAAPVPPRWAFGYLQSRWGWTDKAYIDDALKNFQERHLPVDAFIFDFECYTPKPDYSLPPEGAKNFPDFSWNPLLFPDPAAQIAAFGAQGLHIIPIRKPRIGDSDTLQRMHEKGWVRKVGANGERGSKYDQRGIDFENPAVRAWYAAQLEPMLRDGVAGWWNDEGESAYTKYYYWNEAEVTAAARVRPHARTWSINRAFEPGLQRLGAAAWTGDIPTSWESLERTPTALLNWSLAGMPYGACDIGGFSGQVPPEMLTRWMEAGVFFPVMRSHSVIRVTPHFPWLYGPEAEEAMRRALDLRMRLVPYYYSVAHAVQETGVPLMRPLAMEFPDDPQVADLSDQWCMGSGLMAAPILAAGGKRSVYFPDAMQAFEGTETHARGERIEVNAALDQIPLYVRAGTILPLGPVVMNTAQLPGGPLEVEVYPGKDASFTLVEDDGVSDAYLTGAMRKTHFTWDDARHVLSWKQEGPYAGKDAFTSLRAVVFDAAGKKESAVVPLTAAGSLHP